MSASLIKLTNHQLLKAYKEATSLGLSQDFRNLLIMEIKRRGVGLQGRTKNKQEMHLINIY